MSHLCTCVFIWMYTYTHNHIYICICTWPVNMSNAETLVNPPTSFSAETSPVSKSQAAGAFSDIGQEVERRFAELSLESDATYGVWCPMSCLSNAVYERVYCSMTILCIHVYIYIYICVCVWVCVLVFFVCVCVFVVWFCLNISMLDVSI